MGLTVIAASGRGFCCGYLQLEPQASILRLREDKTQWILMISAFCELRSYVTANSGRN